MRHPIPTLVLALSGLFACAVAALAAEQRPNILFCFADDWGRYARAYDAADGGLPSPNQVVTTPSVDRVAKEGVLFRHAYVNAPSCTPCRSALLSGRYFFATGLGAILQRAEWDSAIPTWPLLLRDAGYHIGKMYKVWSPGTPADAGYGGQEHGYEKAGRDFNQFSQNVTKLVEGGMPVEEAKQKLYAQVQANFEAFLAARQGDKPFAFWFGPTNTHRKWTRGSGKALWNIDPDALKGKLPKFLPDVPEIREDFADYLGEAQAFDAAIGVLLKKLKDIGELDRTVVVLSGDHGAPGFPGGKCNLYDFGVGVALAIHWPGQPGGRVVEDFVNLMDLAPTFLEIGGVPIPRGMQARSLVNVLRSDKSGWVDPVRDYVVTGRERHCAAAREDNLPYPHRAFRTKDFLYIRNFAADRWPMGAPIAVTATEIPSHEELVENTFAAYADMDSSPTKAWIVEHRNDPKWKWAYDYAFGKRPAEELYDLRNDPDQIKNLADDAAHAETKRGLSERLMRVLNANGDPRVTGDGKTFERPPFTDPAPEPPKSGKKKKK